MTQLIAEFCQNHNGNVELLARMVEAAAKAGATHGKMQSILANTIAFRPQFEKGLVIDGVVKSIKRPYADEYHRLKSLEINQEYTLRFIQLCEDNGLIPMTTCFVRAHAQGLASSGFKSVKVASYDCASYQMLRELKPLFDEIVVSTGATFDEEIEHASRVLEGSNYSFLHCITIYPTPLDQTNLARMNWLRKFAPRVGFSDHTLFKRDELIASKAALALGAEVIERHFTILEPNESRDGAVSITPDGMRNLAKFASLPMEERLNNMNTEYPNWRITIGQERRQLSETELLNRDYYRGRFGSPRSISNRESQMIFNWEETPI